MGNSPRLNWAILAASTSTQATSTPNSAKQAPVTSPTYPEPITAMCIQLLVLEKFPAKHTGHAHTASDPQVTGAARIKARHQTGMNLTLPGRTENGYAATKVKIVVT